MLDFSSEISLALLTQTTLSLDETSELTQYIQQKYPHIVLPAASDICYATTNRQNAVKKLSEVVDAVFVIGSKNSSNSTKLKLTAEKL
jgi:4-hydroxy-3-methylbut-2-en-1-yl diphosphate reductase